MFLSQWSIECAGRCWPASGSYPQCPGSAMLIPLNPVNLLAARGAVQDELRPEN
jgi:hypothetical protein